MGYTVLSVAYPLTEVGENAVGGSEQVLASLDRALTASGCRSLVIAAEGSKISGKLIASPAFRGKLDPTVRKWGETTHRQLIHDTLRQYSVDLVHMHSLDFHRYLPDPEVPTLATLHLPPDWYPAEVFKLDHRRLRLNCVSASQERACPQSRLLIPHVPNGVDVARFRGGNGNREYALALGRICPEKGFHFAIDASKSARVQFLLAGEVFPYAAHEDYFRAEISPRLDGRRRFLGPVGFSAKRRLLLGAKCLLIPSTVQETSSLVAMEALAAGTPVIAFRSGALPEIVEHGKTGYLVSDAREMAEAIAAVHKLDALECRKAARARFSAETMVSRYTDVYRQFLSIEPRSIEPRTLSATSWLVSW